MYSETVYLSEHPGRRFIVTPDHDADSPLTWGWEVETWAHPEPAPEHPVLRAYAAATEGWTPDGYLSIRTRPEEFALRFARIFGFPTADLAVAENGRAFYGVGAESLATTYDEWCAGNVWSVTEEELDPEVHLPAGADHDCDDEFCFTESGWLGSSISGIYASDAEDAARWFVIY